MSFLTPKLSLLAIGFVFFHNCLASSEPIGQWRFDSTTLLGDSLKSTVGPWTGKVQGTASLTKDKPTSLDASKGFNGIILSEDIGLAGLPAKDITITIWVRIDKVIEWGGLLGAIQDNGSFERGWLLGYGKESFYFAIASESKQKLTYLKTTLPYSPGYWYHLAGTYDGTSQRVYVDGKLAVESKVQSGPIFYPPKGRFALGAYTDDNERHPFEGRIEQVTLWDRALDPKEIARLFDERKKLFPATETVASPATSEDWPTFLHDNEQSGKGVASIQGKLSLRWTHRLRLPPEPAWPPPAKQDFWHKKYNLKPRVIFDRAFHIVGAGDRIYLASSADDQTRCLSLTDGTQLWSHFAEAPVRLAPTVAGNRILCGGDDGFVRCLDATDGKLLWKSRPTELGDRRIPGNGRIINERPIRTGILVEGQTGYFGAGLFPTQGTYLFSLDIRNGRILDRESLSISPQGYLSRKHGKLFAPTGRNPAGAFLGQLARRGKSAGAPAKKIPEKYPHAFIESGDLKFAGGDGEIAVFHSDGSLVQTLPVTGKAHSLAVIRGKLVVSTDLGIVHCFSAGEKEPVHVKPAELTPFPKKDDLARQALATTKATKGYCLVIGAKEAALAASIARLSDLKVVVSASKDEGVGKLRRDLANAGLYGNEIVVHERDIPRALPYADHLFNLIVTTDPGIPEGEILRLLQPRDGVALLGQKLEKRLSKPPIEGGGEWTHLYAGPGNTACSQDQGVAADLSIQWFGRPGPERLLDRHHRSVSPLWKNGFLFIPGNERVFGVDAYNGAVLWETEVPESRRIAIMRDCGSMSVDDDFMYVASGAECLALDILTGKVVRRLAIPGLAAANNHDWGYVGKAGAFLIGSAVKKGGIRRDYGHGGIREAYWDNRPPVCSDSIFAIAPRTGKPAWTYLPADGGSIVNSSIAAGPEGLHFVESPTPSKEGRVSYDEILGNGKGHLVTLDLKSGETLRRIPLPAKKAVQSLYLVTAKGVLALVNSRNEKTVHYDVRAYDAKDGKLLWEQTHDNRLKLNGSHGEQDKHPVILNGELYVEPMIYNLQSGIPAEGRKLARGGGCGALSASANALYFRSRNPTAYLPSTGKFKKITTVSRPGCWINAIPAGGMLLIPEASSGCTCAFPIQCSLAFAPRSKPKP
jgi:outer membrane protein assembly factor BamB